MTPTLISLPLYTSGGRSGERARVIVDDRYDELPPQRVYSGRGVGGGYPYEGGEQSGTSRMSTTMTVTLSRLPPSGMNAGGSVIP